VDCFILQREQWFPRPIEEAFAFFADARNLEVITPSWLGFRILTAAPIAMGAGTLIEYQIRGILPMASLTCNYAGPTACGSTRTPFTHRTTALSCVMWSTTCFLSDTWGILRTHGL
jgi:hypothetical protein